jgi:hypothetical protein
MIKLNLGSCGLFGYWLLAFLAIKNRKDIFYTYSNTMDNKNVYHHHERYGNTITVSGSLPN